jgi:hypothetical protein
MGGNQAVARRVAFLGNIAACCFRSEAPLVAYARFNEGLDKEADPAHHVDAA